MQFAYALWLRRFRLAGHAFRAKDRFDHYTAYYDAGTSQRVAEIYRSDIEVLGYTF
ncbi:MAG: hypothetical protein O3A10_08045 [Chloroflexi bacterium]|nr:hypothetical protein [Chloroflexota bacterium]MDA1146426.1 hypothetical protein [Chloroflexota bacterium]